MTQCARRVVLANRHQTVSSSSSAVIDATADAADKDYVSPYKDLFDLMEQGKPIMREIEADPPNYTKSGVDQNLIRYKTTHYGHLVLPPHVMKWEHRVTMILDVKDIPLEKPEEFAIMKEIVGQRMTQHRLQISSNEFGSRIENKRHLVSMLDRIILGARRLAAEMEDGGAGGNKKQIEAKTDKLDE
eukprot:CAMPEP_0194049714 /NCGR_PEP_ID=MMETSP0009_2-20130614/30851_1 /TAXON_ID=210454 /ORGANISM="Grammatophora oceanica, Strain CCMP 410" /LENGTH=186 /DNA_ID=CAMNT_0038695929 /DNA_START=108 /DNA_END=668 /DNA_ORIENTATION=-